MTTLAPAASWTAKRVRVEHGDGIRPHSVAEAVRRGIVVTRNSTHLPAPAVAGVPPLSDWPSMLSALLDAGVPLAFGPGAGADEADPFLNSMLARIDAASPSEALTRERVLLVYTAGAASAEHQEAHKGRVKPGMAADLVVLSQDILTVPVGMAPAIGSVLTLVDGEIVIEDLDAADLAHQ